MIDGRIVGATEELVRKAYNLSNSYEPTQCSVKKNHVEIEMNNGLISIRVKIPRDIIDAHLSGECITYMISEDNIEANESSESDKVAEETNESSKELDELTDDSEGIQGNQEKDATTKSKRRIKKHGKGTKKES